MNNLMATYYLDIETTGLDPKKDKITTIQYQELDRNTAEPIGKLKILKEWETSESEIIKKFIKDSKITDKYKFSFVPVGYNLWFEHNYIREKCEQYALPKVDILDRPFIDIHTCAVIMNKGEFKNSGLDKMTKKPSSGKVIPLWYEKKEYNKIINYIEIETVEFIRLTKWLYKELPEALTRFRRITE